MKKFVMPAMIALAVTAGPALAADMGAPVYKAPAPVAVDPWNVAIGASIATDYNFRGISQSDRGPSVGAYFEAQYNVSSNFQLYAAIAGASVDLVTSPTAEIDYYGGFRLTTDKLTWDFGVWYYQYPREIVDTDFLEFYGKVSWAVTDAFTLGTGVFYADDWLKTGASGTYWNGTAKYTFTTGGPAGAYLSGEFGHYFLGTTSPVVALGDLPDYSYWNVGIGFTYKALTLDLRYHDTNLSQEECSTLTGDVSGINAVGFTTSNWCKEAYVAKLSFDTTLNDLK